LIKSFKRNPKSRYTVVYGAKVSIEGYGEKWVYYNMQDEDDPNYKWVQRPRKAIVDAIEENLARMEDWFQIDPHERRRRQEAFEEEIEMEAERQNGRPVEKVSIIDWLKKPDAGGDDEV
jgi:hypothetical protein